MVKYHPERERGIFEKEMNMENSLTNSQIDHIKKLVELSIRYVQDCYTNECDACPLGKVVTKHTEDLPVMPEGVTLCSMFDYISQNQ